MPSFFIQRVIVTSCHDGNTVAETDKPLPINDNATHHKLNICVGHCRGFSF